MKEWRIQGLDNVVNNLNREVEKIKKRSLAGLIESADLILTDTEKTPPLVPVDTGNLRSSRFITPAPHSTSPKVHFGFSANYAMAVHEKVGANFKRPGAGAKFLEASVKRNKDKVIKIVRDNAKIK